jgi:SAM-dependent methyltransferase
MIQDPKLRLVLCGLAALYWELVLIRWLSACIRIIGYYTNFVLIAAFFGLGLGALLTRHRFRFSRWIFPIIAACVLLGTWLGSFSPLNPNEPSEYIWLGAPVGIGVGGETRGALPLWFILSLTYLGVSAVFVAFGQWLGELFSALPSLEAYTTEIIGSLLGIWVFAAMSFLQTSPVVWMAVGAAALLLIVEKSWISYATGVVCTAVVIAFVLPVSRQFIWSPYYKIKFEPVTEITDIELHQPVKFPGPIGYSLTVNNDYHQMLLNLGKENNQHPFFESWRRVYDAPYELKADLPSGPILVVGAGTGNDVMAALRSTGREVYAVDIDPIILRLGNTFHFERPYQDPRVRVFVDDARSFFQKTTQEKFALVVFGFLDSHTLFSSFSSLRLDNFVYTRDSLEQVKRILLPGGQVTITFASNTQWIHRRVVSLLDEVFDARTQVSMPHEPAYGNGIVYRNFKAPLPAGAAPRASVTPRDPNTPTDDWPFLYLQEPRVPAYYRVFLAVVLTAAAASLFALPPGRRRIRLPYFFLGAAFFLLETSNIVSLSLLYGSTWIVNVCVFSGILMLVLLGNWFSARRPRLDLRVVFAALAVNIVLAYFTPPAFLLAVSNPALKAAGAVVIFLGPVFFASLVFAQLIRQESELYQAYGSNILGAVVGGATEYLSMVWGFKFLLCITLSFYVAAFILVPPLAKLKPKS